MTAPTTAPVLVIGASGLVGRRLVRTLLEDGVPVRGLARNPARIADLAAAGCEVLQGDILDVDAVERAVAGAGAVYISVHTLSPQPGGRRGQRFMDIEGRGVDNVIAAARTAGVRRLVYVTSLGIGPDAPGEWLRERWRVEQRLLQSGLDATVMRPGVIVGVGGHGFDTIMAQARRRVAVTMMGDRPLFRAVALDDLVRDLIGVRDAPQTFGRRFDVGGDDVLSFNAMIDIAANVLGRPPPAKVLIPRPWLRALAPLLGRMAGLPRGAFPGLVASMTADSIGDPTPLRTILPYRRLSFREAAALALKT